MTQPTTPDPARAIDALVNQVPVLVLMAGTAEGELLQQRFCEDMANENYGKLDIAVRYGLRDETGLRAYLTANPHVVQAIKRLKATRESDGGVKGVVRTRSGHALSDRLHHIGGMIGDPRIKPEDQLKAATLLSRMAGLDGVGRDPAAAADTANQFVVNFHFTGRTDRVTATIDGAAVEGPDITISDETDEAPAP